MKEVDTNEDGAISFQEFLQMMTQYKDITTSSMKLPMTTAS